MDMSESEKLIKKVMKIVFGVFGKNIFMIFFVNNLYVKLGNLKNVLVILFVFVCVGVRFVLI